MEKARNCGTSARNYYVTNPLTFSTLWKRSVYKEVHIIMPDYINSSELVDIRNVSVDKTMPKHERIMEYIRQIKNPYKFKCGKFTVTARFAESGPTLEDCLQRLMA